MATFLSYPVRVRHDFPWLRPPYSIQSLLLGLSADTGSHGHLAKEMTVAPHENVRTQIERQILIIDRAIHWVEKFK
jgi:hypothetical protein